MAGASVPAMINPFADASLRFAVNVRTIVTSDSPMITIVPTPPEMAANSLGPGSVSASRANVNPKTSLPSGMPSVGSWDTDGARNVAKNPNTSHSSVGVRKRLEARSDTTSAIDPAASKGMLAIPPKK